ncbi:phage portal protein [Sphingomonas faeni]|uniref:phage portal protein n=1 Tax=Sphingomonas faeni TaxID=185950 RepID=UPI00334DDB15
MKLFGWKSGREESRPVLSRALSTPGFQGAFGDAPQSYEAQVRDGYLRNPIVQRAVKLVVEGVGSAPLIASDPALLALVTARSGGQSLIETVAAQMLLHGNAYVQVLRDVDGGAAELFALRPERVAVEADASGWPAAYRYRVGERLTRLQADPVRPEVIHLKSFNPVDDHYGLGCLGAASGAVAIHNAAARWNKALLDNAARPSGALVFDPGDGTALSGEQFARLKGELEESFSGAGNAGRPMLLEGGLRWQALSLSPADMDFVGTKAAAAREIALAFGVPPMLLGLPGDNSYANYREANRALWRVGVLPIASAVLTGIAQGLTGWFAGAAISIDLDRVPALVEDRERLWGMVSGASFLSDAEKRAMLQIQEVA